MTLETYLDKRSVLSIARAEAELRILIIQREIELLNNEIAELDGRIKKEREEEVEG